MLFAKIVDILRFKCFIEFAIASNRQSIYRNIASVGRLKPSNERQQGRFRLRLLMSGAPVCEKDFFKSFIVSIIRRFVLNRLV